MFYIFSSHIIEKVCIKRGCKMEERWLQNQTGSWFVRSLEFFFNLTATNVPSSYISCPIVIFTIYALYRYYNSLLIVVSVCRQLFSISTHTQVTAKQIIRYCIIAAFHEKIKMYLFKWILKANNIQCLFCVKKFHCGKF